MLPFGIAGRAVASSRDRCPLLMAWDFLLVGGDGRTNRKKVMIVATLTAKQQRFCDEYLIDLNATQAAIRAGYSKKTAKQIGQENLTKPDLLKYIDERMNEKEKSLIADQDEVLRYLTSVLRGNSKAHILARDELGADRVIQKPPDEKEKLKAAELLGKRYGLYTDKVDVNGTIPVVIAGADDLAD